jgi:hypothetical protein
MDFGMGTKIARRGKRVNLNERAVGSDRTNKTNREEAPSPKQGIE